MEMQICMKGIMIAVFFAMVIFLLLIIISQVSILLSCKEKIEATLIDVEITKEEKGTERVAVPHESRYSKYSYTYKPKKEYMDKKVYNYTYHPVYQYEYDNQCFTRPPMNVLDYFENRTFEKKDYEIGQKCYLYIDPKRPALCVTKRFSLMNTLIGIWGIVGAIFLAWIFWRSI